MCQKSCSLQAFLRNIDSKFYHPLFVTSTRHLKIRFCGLYDGVVALCIFVLYLTCFRYIDHMDAIFRKVPFPSHLSVTLVLNRGLQCDAEPIDLHFSDSPVNFIFRTFDEFFLYE